jgi:hypothetical protein
MTLPIAHFREWWTAEEVAASGLPDLPASRQGVEAFVKRLGWRGHPEFARRRNGRGGGWEYFWQLFPSRAQVTLLKRANATPVAPARPDRSEMWVWFDGLPEKVKEQARARLLVIQRIEGLATAMTKFLAIDEIARAEKIAPRTVWNWLELIEGVDVSDRLAYLAPRHRAAAPKRARAECDPQFLDWLKADYLRLEAPSFSSCYDRVVGLCQAHGVKHLNLRTARRWVDDNIQRVTLVLAREGERGLARCFPPQIRDRSTLTAMEAVNADCHKIDVFVQWPGIEKPVRPQIAAFQDLFSNKFLSYRVDLDPNKVAVMAAWGELVETFGIPRHCLFDNGMEFANKWMTGGTKTRFRFTVREDDALGVLPQMGVQVHWATPAHGQAKPVERAFKDWCDRVAKHPAFAGAYVGNRPDAKPENYMSRAIPLADFLETLDREIAAHNARPGRLTDNARGRSFDETFAESYATAKIKKATPEQHRLWLMGQEKRKLHKGHGQLTLHKNGYWADWMNQFAGQEVLARFNPEDLHEGLYIYSLAGEFLGFAECREKVGFFDMVGAKLHAKVERGRKKAAKELLRQMRPISVDQYAADLAALPQPETPLIEAKVVEIMPVRHQQPLIARPMPVPEIDPAIERRRAAMVVDFRPADQPEKPVETAKDRFQRAIEIEARSEAGKRIGAAEADWLRRYQTTPEYTSRKMMLEDFGKDKFIG